jgi:hypothetical protein
MQPQDTEEALLLPPDGAVVEETRLTRSWIGPDGFLRIVLKPNSVASVKDAADLDDVVRRLVGESRPPVIADIREIASTDHWTREYYRNMKEVPVCAVAFLVRSTLSRTIGNFFLGMGGFSIPARIFSSPSEALAWLEVQRGSASR